MSNPKIIYANLSDWKFTLSGDTSDPANPIGNLSDYLQNTKWMSQGYPSFIAASYQSLIIDTGGVSSFNSILIDNHNLDSVMLDNTTQPILVQTGSTTSFTSGVGTVLTISTSSVDAYYGEFPLVSSSAWRIFYNGIIANPPFIGNLFLCNHLKFDSTNNWNYIEDVPKHTSVSKRTANGINKFTQSNNNFARLYSRFEFTLQTLGLKERFRAFASAIRGRLYPFYFINSHDIIRYVNSETDLNNAMVTRYGQNSIMMEMTTQSTSNNWSYVPYTNLAFQQGNEIYGIIETNEAIVI